MTDYSELVEDLRDIEKTMFALGTSPINMDNVSIRLAYDKRWGRTANNAAAAIEALEAEVKRLEPKRGKWITHPEVKNIYGGAYIECPFCGEKYVVQNVSDEKFCRNCGADLRAKMEDA